MREGGGAAFLTFVRPCGSHLQLGVGADQEPRAGGLYPRAPCGRTRGFLLGRDLRLLVDGPERLIVDPQDAMGAGLVIEPEKSG